MLIISSIVSLIHSFDFMNLDFKRLLKKIGFTLYMTMSHMTDSHIITYLIFLSTVNF